LKRGDSCSISLSFRPSQDGQFAEALSVFDRHNREIGRLRLIGEASNPIGNIEPGNNIREPEG
jgi:hypothetical protein